MRPQRINVDIESLTPLSPSTNETLSTSSSDSTYHYFNNILMDTSEVEPLNSPIRRRQSLVSAHQIPPIVEVNDVERYFSDDSESTFYDEDDELNGQGYTFTLTKSFIMFLLFFINAIDRDTIHDGYSNYSDLWTYSITNYPYCEDKRYEVWRLISNSFVHKDFRHLFGNLLLFLYSGYLLEFYIGFFKTMLVFTTSTLIGNLSMLNLNPYVICIGCSHSVFGIIGSILTNVVINYDTMKCIEIYLYLFSVIFVVSLEIGFYLNSYNENVGYIAHWGGFTNGFLISFLIIKPERNTKFKYCMTMIFLQSLLWLYIYLFYNYFTNWPKTIVYNERFEENNFDNCCLDLFKKIDNNSNFNITSYNCNLIFEDNSYINL